MLTDFSSMLLTLAKYSKTAADLLRAAVCESRRGYVGEISDLNRQAISDLAELERGFLTSRQCSRELPVAAFLLTASINRAFSAATLIPDPIPHLPALAEIVSANASLAAYSVTILETDAAPSFYSLHLSANKGRGAHAILVNNYCNVGAGYRLLPAALALESHRNALEYAATYLGTIDYACFCKKTDNF